MIIVITITAIAVGMLIGYTIGFHVGFRRAAVTSHELLKEILTKKQYEKFNKRSIENEVK